MNSAVVTGATGFVGQALVRELAKNGVHVFAVVRNAANGTAEIRKLSGIQIISCSMDDISSLPAHISTRPDIFYHLAWSGSTGPERGDYRLQLKNATWALDAVHVAAELECRRFVGVGSSAELDARASAETDGFAPNVTSHYGSAKIAAHYMSKAECDRLGLEHVWARLANIYGIGDHSSNFINFAAKRMLSGQSVDFTSGEQLYDFAYISDIAQGLYRLGQYGCPNTSYFVGSGHPQKLKMFIAMLRDEIDPTIMLRLGAIPFHGISLPESCFDCGPLIQDTGYRPQVEFQDGIKLFIYWLRKNVDSKAVRKASIEARISS